jgi:hypothetical protein
MHQYDIEFDCLIQHTMSKALTCFYLILTDCPFSHELDYKTE